MSNWESYIEENKTTFLDEFFDFIRIPSVSAMDAHIEDVKDAAIWVQDRMQTAGIENVEVMETGGHPVVYGDWLHVGTDKPTVMIYGHFDVQPPDPIDLWESPPFEPTVRDGKIFARGASDDKGGLLSSILGIEAILKTIGTLPVNLKFCYEGQEEIGSPQLEAFLEKYSDKFSCDIVFSADGLQWSNDQPMLVLGLKALTKVEIEVTGPNSDLHSGIHGGVLNNPLEALANILASLRDDDGKIAVEGFFDNVIDPTPEERTATAAIPFDEEAYKSELGIADFFGEPNFTNRERNWFRPTIDINGIWGGYQGDGSKTVIPSKANAKITCRLVADQQPERIGQLIQDHIEMHCPTGTTVKVTWEASNKAKPYYIPAEHVGNQVAKAALTKLYGKEPYYVRVGGSIPVSSHFLNSLGVDMIGYGWSLGTENLHAPNEYFPVENFYRGIRGYCLLMEELVDFKMT